MTSTAALHAPDPVKVRRTIAAYLATGLDLNTMLKSVVSSWPIVYDAAVVDADGKAILHTNPDLVGKNRPRPS